MFKGDNKESSITKFNIKKGWKNAGKLNKIGESAFEEEVETLIPPFSVCTIESKQDGFIELNLAKDNDVYDYDMDIKK